MKNPIDLTRSLPAETPSADLAEPIQVSYLTHELRAPLTSVRSALGLLQEKLDRKLNDEEEDILRLALLNTDRLASLITDILDYAKIQAGKFKPITKAVYPKPLIHEACDSLRAWAISKGIKVLRIPHAEPLPRVKADPVRTVQVLINLLSNAIKFTPSMGKIEVSATRGTGEHAGTVVFSVKDTGRGIRREDLERIFKCFEQSWNGATIPGSGLGLTLAKAMVELQGGRIWAESWRGLGSTFRFTVPIATEDLSKPIAVYPKPIQYHGILVNLFRRFNAVLAYFV